MKQAAWRWILWSGLALIPAGLLIRIDIGSGGLLLIDLFIPFVAASWLCWQVWIIRKWKKVNFALSAVILLGWMLIGWAWGSIQISLFESFAGLLHIIRWITVVIFGLAVAHQTTKDKKFRENFWHICNGMIALTLIFGLIQFFIFPSIAELSTQGGWDPHKGRLLGTWLDPNILSGWLGFIIPVLAGQFYASKKNREKLWLGLLSGLAIICLFLTFSRSGYLGGMLGLGIFLIFRDIKIILIACIIVSIGAISHPTSKERVIKLGETLSSIILQEDSEIDITARLRVESWQKSLSLLQYQPWMGIGYNNYRAYAIRDGIVKEGYFSSGGADSSLLTLLITTGWIGIVLWFGFFWSLWWSSWQKWWHCHDPIHLGFCSGLLATVAHSTFTNSLLFPLIFLTIMTIKGYLEGNKNGK